MNTSRRSFLKAAGATGLFNIIPAKTLWGETAPSNQLTRAIIGFGAAAHGDCHLSHKGSRLVGLCDPFASRVEEGLECAEKAGWGKIKAYGNFAELIADSGVDIVHVCTPPHWHGVQCVMASRAGKAVWCETPMSRTVGEGKRILESVKAKKCMFRVSSAVRASDEPLGNSGLTPRRARHLVAAGAFGKGPLRCVVGEGQGFPWNFAWAGRVKQAVEPLPEGFDYEMWLGPAPWRPYSGHRVGRSFRGYWDYDSGALGDTGQQYLDPVQYVLGKDEESPVAVDYAGPFQHPEAVGFFNRITLSYADGTEVVLDGDGSLRNEPFIRGSALSSNDVAQPPEAGSKLGRLLADTPEPPPLTDDFVESVRTQSPFCLNEDRAFRSATMVNLASAAWRTGRGFKFDQVSFCAEGCPAANRFLHQSTREPWRTEMAI